MLHHPPAVHIQETLLPVERPELGHLQPLVLPCKATPGCLLRRCQVIVEEDPVHISTRAALLGSMRNTVTTRCTCRPFGLGWGQKKHSRDRAEKVRSSERASDISVEQVVGEVRHR